MTETNKGKAPEVKTAKKHNYGKYFFVFLIFSWIYRVFIEDITLPSLSEPVAFLLGFLDSALTFGAFYFLVLWIMDAIRRRGGVERDENKKAKLIVNIIFGILIIGLAGSIFLALLNTSSKESVPTFIDEFQQKQQELVDLNSKQKTIVLDVESIEDSQQLKRAFLDLLSNTQEVEVIIYDLKLLIDKNSDVLESEHEKKAVTVFEQSIDFRERHNSKLIELATLGLRIDWDNPSETQIAEWTKIAQELSEIEKEVQLKQLEF